MDVPNQTVKVGKRKQKSKRGKASKINKPARVNYRLENRRDKNKRIKQERHKKRFPNAA